MIQLHPADVGFIVTRLPKDIQELLVKHSLYLGGGFIRDSIAGNKPTDIDLFGPTIELQGALARGLEREREGRLVETDNALTLLSPPRLPVQFITRWLYDQADHVAESFDFTVCQAVVWNVAGKWRSAASDRFYIDLAARRLFYTSPVREEEPGGSLLRARKFLSRGYNIQVESLAALMARIYVKLDLRGESEEDVAAAVSKSLREVDPLRLGADGEAIVVNDVDVNPEQF